MNHREGSYTNDRGRHAKLVKRKGRTARIERELHGDGVVQQRNERRAADKLTDRVLDIGIPLSADLGDNPGGEETWDWLTLRQFIARERERVAYNRKRARNAGTADTLTIAEWLEILRAYGGFCAYCGERPYETMEHVYPLAKGGDTSKENVLPCCRQCNTMHDLLYQPSRG